MNKTVGIVAAVIVVAGIGITALAMSNNGDEQVNNAATKPAATITGAGSTFAAPLYSQLGSEYKKSDNVTINYQPVGSGAGVSQFIAKTVNYGATDVPLKDSEVEKAQANGEPMNIPVAFGAITVSYNVSGLKTGLKLDGPTIANIYLGKITKWNDPAIASLNEGVSLPDVAITPVYRSDSSGTTSQFTEYLAGQSQEWKDQIGSDKTVKWPVGTGAKGNDGVAATTSQTEGAIGYVELAYAIQNKFTFASVKNKNNEFIVPSLDSTSKAGENIPDMPEDLRFNSVDSPAMGAYPIASPTFIVVYEDPCKAGAVKNGSDASALRGWLDYLLGDGQESMKKLEYAPLASSLQDKAKDKVSSMTCNGEAIASR